VSASKSGKNRPDVIPKGNLGPTQRLEDDTKVLSISKVKNSLSQGELYIYDTVKNTLVFQDKDILVINKPAQVVCDDKNFRAITDGFESKGKAQGSIARFLLANFAEHFPDICKVHNLSTTNFGALNRLDRETSGCVLVALSEKTKDLLEKQRNDHEFHKEYVALVHGWIPQTKARGCINYPLKKK